MRRRSTAPLPLPGGHLLCLGTTARHRDGVGVSDLEAANSARRPGSPGSRRVPTTGSNGCGRRSVSCCGGQAWRGPRRAAVGARGWSRRRTARSAWGRAAAVADKVCGPASTPSSRGFRALHRPSRPASAAVRVRAAGGVCAGGGVPGLGHGRAVRVRAADWARAAVRPVGLVARTPPGGGPCHPVPMVGPWRWSRAAPPVGGFVSLLGGRVVGGAWSWSCPHHWSEVRAAVGSPWPWPRLRCRLGRAMVLVTAAPPVAANRASKGRSRPPLKSDRWPLRSPLPACHPRGRVPRRPRAVPSPVR